MSGRTFVKALLARHIRRFLADQRANIAIIFALSSTMIVVGIGSGIDLSRAFVARQKLSQVAALTCQYSVRPSVVALANSTYSGTSGFSTYISTVNTFASNALSNQHWSGVTPTAPSGTFFTATASTSVTDSTAPSTAPSNPTVELSAQVQTYFMGIAKVPTITVHAKVACLTASTTPQIVTATGPTSTTNYIAQETFSTSCGWVCYTYPNGTAASNWPLTVSSSSAATTASPGYTGSHGLKWYILGYCLEEDSQGAISSQTIGSTNSVELDCDNGSGSAGNSSISTQIYMAAGRYELRYNYRSRVGYPNYDPTYICGTTAADVSWANDTVIAGSGPSNDNGSALRTNQMNVYFDLATSSTVPLHTTIDGTQRLGGTNLIDMCVYSSAWVQRSVKITISTPAYYWLSFAADGQNDSFGAQLDNIMVCQETCPGTPTDNFPSTWLAANNGGVNKILFEDGFESPVYTSDPSVTTPHAKGANLASFYGTTVSTGCYYGTSYSTYASPPGWPCQQSTGWTMAPYNETVIWLKGAYQGNQYISLQGWNGDSVASDPINRMLSRKFLLDPGYYNISYDYLSMIYFSGLGITSPICYYAPASGTIFSTSVATGTERYYSNYSVNTSTDILGVFMSNSLEISTPNGSTTLGGAATYTNLDGTTTTAPELAPYGVNWANYNAAVVNPVIDTCGYSPSYAWVPRGANVLVTKPGWYWLTFSAYGDALTGAGAGPALDDVKLTALGSPYMSSAPTTALTTIPVPAPVHDSDYYGLNSTYNGFYIVADPLTPPAADQ